jgi:hypothetical protein
VAAISIFLVCQQKPAPQTKHKQEKKSDKQNRTCVSASVLLISRLKISLAAIMANGVSSPSA